MAKRTVREQLMTYISDAHKDAYGFRPRGIYNHLNLVELRKVADELSEAVGEACRQQQAAQAQAAVEYELRITNLINCGAGNRETAIRWDKESYDDLYISEDESYYEYQNGLKYGYFREQREGAEA